MSEVIKTCQSCNVEFTVNFSQRKTAKFCSRQCVNQSLSREKISKICLNCNADFQVHQCFKDAVFCSKSCRYQYNQTTISCLNCNESFTVGKHLTNRKIYCSKVCQIAYKDKNLIGKHRGYESGIATRKTYQFRIYPSKSQITVFENLLELCREVYNAALQERRDAWELNKIPISQNEQRKQLSEVRQIRDDVAAAPAHVLAEKLQRIENAYNYFFSRIKKGEKAGKPRFKSNASKMNSFTYPELGGNKILNGKLILSKIGKVKIKVHREIEGKVKTITVKRKCGKWFAFLSVECFTQPLPQSFENVGIDVGIKNFATFSNGEQILNPNFGKLADKKLRVAQRKVSRRKKDSIRRKKAVLLLQKVYAKITNQKQDFQHKESRKIVNRFDLITVEDLKIQELLKNKTTLNKSINDVSWGGFLQKLAYKAESAGRKFVKVDPRNTTQNCSNCGFRVVKDITVRVHDCGKCGLKLDRDENAALNILRLGNSLQAQTYDVNQSVA